MNTFHLVHSFLNPQLELWGVLLTMYDSRTNLSQQVVEETRRVLKDKVFRTVIPRNVRLSEAPSFGKPIIMYDVHSIGATAYWELAEEVLENE